MPTLIHTTPHGRLYHGDALALMEQMDRKSIDLFFADPPFNLNKEYGKKVNDNLSETEYTDWMHTWLDLAVPLLSDGGAMWVYNLPKWNLLAGAHLMNNPDLTFRHQVAISMKSSFPIKNKLYPAHYSLLYFIKGKRPRVFNNIRTPYERCRHCGGLIKDYGGHFKKMNPAGVNLTDIWTDLSPVRHRSTKYRKANALPEQMLERILSISSNEGDTIFDPFGGSGTTYAVAERMHRSWIGIEIGDTDPIIARLNGSRIPDTMPNTGASARHRGIRGQLFDPTTELEKQMSF